MVILLHGDPGDEFVDWVGFSIYHYGKQWPWETNDVPEPGKIENILNGKNKDTGPFHFYEMFSGTIVPSQFQSSTVSQSALVLTEFRGSQFCNQRKEETNEFCNCI